MMVSGLLNAYANGPITHTSHLVMLVSPRGVALDLCMHTQVLSPQYSTPWTGSCLASPLCEPCAPPPQEAHARCALGPLNRCARMCAMVVEFRRTI